MAEAIFTSWRFDPLLLGALMLAAWLYVRGWRKMYAQSPGRYTPERLVAYLGGLAALFIALASPLDAFGNLLLMAHMAQHLLLIVVAPPLILLGQPILPLLRGLPPYIFKEGLGPFLSSHRLQRFGRGLTHPVVCWLAMAAAIVFWHMPRWYDLSLQVPAWHELEHACFFYAALLFWSPVIGIWPNRPHWPRWLMISYLVLADVVNTALSAWLVFSSHVVYRTYEMAPRIAGMSALDDQSTAGAIMWVPGSIAFLIPALILTMQAINGDRPRPQLVRIGPAARPPAPAPLDLLRMPLIGPILRYRHFRRIAQSVLVAMAVAVIVDGFRGPQIAPLNLAGILPWTYWRGFAAIALLAAGNLFCMACPFTLVRDLGRRALPGKFHWPRALRSKWLAITLLCVYLWANEVFSLWNNPWWTAWVVLGYFLAAFLLNGLFQGASFCKYVCPIGQFHFVNTLISPLEVRVRSPAVCIPCKTEDCIRGNDANRGCELYLFQPLKTGNFDCTFCLDCVHACPHENVGIIAGIPGSALLEDRRGSGIGRLSQRSDAAALVWVAVFGALVSAAVMVDPVMRRMHAIYAGLGLRSMTPVTTGLFVGGLILLPLLLVRTCGAASAHFGGLAGGWRPQARSFAFAMIPLGASMWTAHFAFHLFSGWQSIVPVANRIFGLPAAALVFSAQAPSWLPATQLLVLGAGLVLSVGIAWNTARQQTNQARSAIGILLPWSLLAIGFYATGVWIFFQPMQMRGMAM
jgi:cytochrome c oxidase assembly factor CtaG